MNRRAGAEKYLVKILPVSASETVKSLHEDFSSSSSAVHRKQTYSISIDTQPSVATTLLSIQRFSSPPPPLPLQARIRLPREIARTHRHHCRRHRRLRRRQFRRRQTPLLGLAKTNTGLEMPSTPPQISPQTGEGTWQACRSMCGGCDGVIQRHQQQDGTFISRKMQEAGER